ncbi:MAG: dihydrofolate reductase family protein [Candidatus Thorarchaeota archaeon]
MRKLLAAINVSLDGYADHEIAIADDELHDFYTDLLNNVDIILFGRVTYKLMESYWPIAPNDPEATASMIKFAHKINNMPKIVFSKTLEKVEWYNTKLIHDDIIKEVKKLKQQSGKSLSVGGISVIQALTNEGLIDDYWILVQPIIIGKGKLLFDGIDQTIKLRLINTKNFKSGVVVLHYQRDENHPLNA